VSLLELLVLAIVQGVTEWLPISSKTYVLLAGLFFSIPFTAAYQLGLALNAATAFSSAVYFRRELASLFRSIFWGRGSLTNYDRSMVLKIITATLTTGAVGVPLFFFFLVVSVRVDVSLMMVLAGLTLIAVVLSTRQIKGATHVSREKVRYVDMMVAGVTQGLAVMPGVSRSGMTIAALLALGVKPQEALRVSFVLSIPASLGSALLVSLVGDPYLSALNSVEALLTGLVAFAVGLGMIGLLLRLGRTVPVSAFGLFVGMMMIVDGLLN
jgi:undecaprenyl-diphosphatase